MIVDRVVGDFGFRRVTHGCRAHAVGVAQERTHEVHVVHAVHIQLKTFDAKHVREDIPRGFGRDPDLQVVEFTDRALGNERTGHRNIGRKSQLRIDGSDEPLSVTDLQQHSRLGEVLPKRFLDEHGSAIGQLVEHCWVLLGHEGEVVDGVGRGGGYGIRQRSEHVRDAELVGERLRLGRGAVRCGAVHNPPHREPGFAVRGEVGFFDDSASANHDNRSRMIGQRDGVGRGGFTFWVVRHRSIRLS